MISQTDLVMAIMRELERQGVTECCMRQSNAVVMAATSIVDEFEKPFVPAEAAKSVKGWLSGDDTGQSSCFMAGTVGLLVCVGGRVGQLERLYREELPSGRAPRCYKLMQDLLDASKVAEAIADSH